LYSACEMVLYKDSGFTNLSFVNDDDFIKEFSNLFTVLKTFYEDIVIPIDDNSLFISEDDDGDDVHWIPM